MITVEMQWWQLILVIIAMWVYVILKVSGQMALEKDRALKKKLINMKPGASMVMTQAPD